MISQVRAAGAAAMVIALAFAVHLSNIFYFEPRMGFARLTDYASFAKLAVGLRSTSWLWSGYAHFATGLALVVLASIGGRLIEPQRPLAGRLIFATGLLAALPFTFTGVCDITGRNLREMLDLTNPGHSDALYGALALLRGIVNNLSIVLLGWFILHLNRNLRRTRRLGFLLGLLGYLTGLTAFSAYAWPGGYGLAYLLTPAWALWMGVEFITDAAHVALPEDV